MTSKPTACSLTDEEVRALAEFDPGYLVALDEIYHPHWVARKLHRIERLRRSVSRFWPKGHPTALIHVTGTNGKGSVAHLIAQVLSLQGVTGSWTGPHVFDYVERFHINAKPAERDHINQIYHGHLRPLQLELAADDPSACHSFAELGILTALHLFDRFKVQFATMEVGAGGRYTPLMALPASACVLTNVGRDHPVTLGPCWWQRALEKGGIARPGVPFFTGVSGRERDFIEKIVHHQGGVVAEPSQPVSGSAGRSAWDLTDHEARNLDLAIAVGRHFGCRESVDSLVPRLGARLEARFQMKSDRVLVDVAHNQDKIFALAERLKRSWPDTKFHFILGLTRNRDAAQVFQPLAELASRVTVTSASYAGRDPRDLAHEVEGLFSRVDVVKDPADALRLAQHQLGEGEMLVLTGSAYMIDQAMNSNPFVRETNASFGRRRSEPDQIP